MLDDELDDGAFVRIDFFDEHVLRPRNELARQEPEQIQRTLLSNGGIFRLARPAISAILAPRSPLTLSAAARTAAATRRAIAPIGARP
ncbi:MAG TPA: hypothetical protein VGT98_01635, partial [Candidatus Elarobacter sp.]|nr:hypothetical protein [Candidatus Elarobacter sp.]